LSKKREKQNFFSNFMLYNKNIKICSSFVFFKNFKHFLNGSVLQSAVPKASAASRLSRSAVKFK